MSAGKRGFSSEAARIFRRRGHNDAKEFAFAIGLKDDYRNDPAAKKDVIDLDGDAHTVKSGEKKWQIFLYSRGRFEKDAAFNVMNGIGDLLLSCIDAFPPEFQAYKADKLSAKNRLRPHMVALAEKLRLPGRLRAFLEKSIFNGSEAKYLTVKSDGKYHVFLAAEVVDLLSSVLEVCNSTARSEKHVPEQKVLFRYDHVNLGELEMRNDSAVHYREVRFNMIKPKVFALLTSKIPVTESFSPFVDVHGRARKVFGRWRRRSRVIS